MILQAKYYSSFRYWLFGLNMPPSIMKAIQSDTRYYIWSAAPEIRSDEVGTSARAAPQIAFLPSHLAIDQGGAGLMHWPSHVAAFKLQWIYRYVEPRIAPWKFVLDHWIANKYHIGRAILFTPRHARDKSFASHLPLSLRYLRSCFQHFQSLPLKQDTSTLSPNVQAEPLFDSWRFTIPFSQEAVNAWREDMEVTTLTDIIDRDTERPFTDSQWEHWFYNWSPHEHRQAINLYADKICCTRGWGRL